MRDTNFYGTNLTAIEAVRLSRSEIALGFEPERWGRASIVGVRPILNGFGGHLVAAKNQDDCPCVARATLIAVSVVKTETDDVRRMLADRSIPYPERRRLWRSWRVRQWRAWETLDHHDRCYVDSLIWVPEDPLSALEALGTS